MSAAKPGIDERHFEQRHEGTPDPWGFRTRWYERRKRAVTRSALPHERYASAIEAGCANGELLARRAPCYLRLLGCDVDAQAVKLARKRVAALGNARVEHRRLPEQWPDQAFDLIVIGELGNHLTPAPLDDLLEAVSRSLIPQGVLLACHWRHPIADAPCDRDTVHAALATLRLPRLLRHEEPDLVLEVGSRDRRSVAPRERLI